MAVFAGIGCIISGICLGIAASMWAYRLVTDFYGFARLIKINNYELRITIKIKVDWVSILVMELEPDLEPEEISVSWDKLWNQAHLVGYVSLPFDDVGI